MQTQYLSSAVVYHISLSTLRFKSQNTISHLSVIAKALRWTGDLFRVFMIATLPQVTLPDKDTAVDCVKCMGSVWVF